MIDRARSFRLTASSLIGLLAHVLLAGCGSDTVDRSREVVDRSVEVVDDKIEVARDNLADAGAEIERTGREGLRQANEGIDRWVAEGRDELGSDYQPIAGAAAAIQCESDSACTIDPKFIDQLGSKPQVLVGEAVALPTQGNSEKGMELSSVRPGSIPDLLGLRDGDVLISLNGTKLASLAAPDALADALSDTHEAALVFEREGKQRTLTITRTSAK